MTYFTGLALGISAGRRLHLLLKDKGFELLHTLPGRRRYHHSALLHNPALIQTWQRALPYIPGLKKIEFTAETGNILIEYSCDSAIIDQLTAYLDQVQKQPSPQSAYGQVGHTIRRKVRRLNHNLLAHSKKTLDIRTVLALFFLVWGSQKLWATATYRPSGYQLLWWAYSLMKGRN